MIQSFYRMMCIIMCFLRRFVKCEIELLKYDNSSFLAASNTIYRNCRKKTCIKIQAVAIFFANLTIVRKGNGRGTGFITHDKARAPL